MCRLDQDILEMIIETKNNVVHIKEQLHQGNTQNKAIDTRVRRLELIFIPAVLVMTYFSTKLIEVI